MSSTCCYASLHFVSLRLECEITFWMISKESWLDSFHCNVLLNSLGTRWEVWCGYLAQHRHTQKDTFLTSVTSGFICRVSEGQLVKHWLRKLGTEIKEGSSLQKTERKSEAWNVDRGLHTRKAFQFSIFNISKNLTLKVRREPMCIYNLHASRKSKRDSHLQS